MLYEVITQTYVEMDRLADREGFVVVYPNGSGLLRARLLTWNAGGCCGYAMRADVDDVGFVRALLDDLAARVAFDRRRVYDVTDPDLPTLENTVTGSYRGFDARDA